MNTSKVILYTTASKGTPFLIVDHINEQLIRGYKDETPIAFDGIEVTLGTHKELKTLATTYRRLSYYLHEARDLTEEKVRAVGKTNDAMVRISHQRLSMGLAEAYDRVKEAIGAPDKIINDWLWGRLVVMARRMLELNGAGLQYTGAGYTYDEMIANAWVASGIGGYGIQKFKLEGEGANTTLVIMEREGEGWKEVKREPFADNHPDRVDQVAQYLPHVRAGIRDITAGDAITTRMTKINGERAVII